MNIAIFASAFHPHKGGVEELCWQLAFEYRSRGFGVVVLTNRWPRSLPSCESIEGTDVIRLPFRFPDGSIKSWLNYLLTGPSVLKELCDVLQKRKIDLMHVQCITASTAYAVAAHDRLHVPLVVSTQGERTMDATGLFQRSRRMNELFANAIAAADAFTACSADTLFDVRSHFKLPQNVGRVIYNGIRRSDFHAEPSSAPNRRYLLAIGRHVPQKGFDVLLRAWAQATVTTHDLVLAGDGPERLKLEQLATELHITDSVRFVGAVDRPAAIELFLNCSFFVLPSRREPLGIVNLEAMAAGKAVVASRTGGVPELVEDQVTGLLVPAGDVDALASAISHLATDTERCMAMGIAGRGQAEKFDWAQIADQYLSIYESVLAKQ